MLTRRQFTHQSLALLGASASGLTRAQGLPLAKIISGFPPGGTLDVMARRVADKLRGAYAGTVVVENKPGAGGQVGVLALKDAPADGSTLLLTPSSMLSIYPYTYPKLRYTLDDVTPVSLCARMDHGLAVGPGVPEHITTLKAFLAWAQAHPANAHYGSPGPGSMPHMVGVLLCQQAKVDLRHIGYRGTVPGMQDLLGGMVSAFWGPTGDYLQHIKTGKLRVLAIASPQRSAYLPGVPTLRELGYDLGLREWYGFFLPGKASADTVRQAAQALQQALKQPEVLEAGKPYGLDVAASSPSELAQLLKADAEQWRPLIQQTGFTAES